LAAVTGPANGVRALEGPSKLQKEIARMEAWKSLEGMSKKQLQAMTKPKKKR
jgi:hypothetical protein